MNFQHCYELLGLEPGCTWEELQSTYRRQVQKWHPDRYEQHPEQQHIAAHRMLELNEAFSVLAEFRRQYGYLPVQLPDATTTIQGETPAESPPEQRPRKPKYDIPDSPAWHVSDPVSARSRKTKGFSPWILVIALFFGAYYLFADFVQDNLIPLPGSALIPPPIPAEPEPGDASLPEAAAQKTLVKPTAPLKNIFTYGDPPGRVYEVQGVPTRTSGDLWFYGESEVYFENGRVASWYNSPANPLKVLDSPEAAPPPAEEKTKPAIP